MTNISRRAALRGIALVTATGATSTAMSDVAAVTPLHSHPWERARRLCDELAEALNDLEAGPWYAAVYPSQATAYPIAFMRWERHSKLAALINFYEKVDDEWSAAATRYDEIDEIADLQIERDFDLHAGMPLHGAREAAEKRRTALHAELSRIEAGNALRKEQCGLREAGENLEQCSIRHRDALHAVLSYRPATMAEFRMRDGFVARYLAGGILLTEEEQDLIFSVA